MTVLRDASTGDAAGVNSEKQLLTNSVVISELEHESEENGSAYSWVSGDLNVAAADTMLLVKNTSDTPLHIHSIEVSSGNVATRYEIHLPTSEVTPTGTAVTGTNLNTGKPNVADATAKSKETDNSQGNVIRDVSLLATTTLYLRMEGLILAKNKSIGVDQVTESTAGSVTIIGHYQD